MRTNWSAYVAAEKNRIVADEDAFERLVDLFKQAHGRTPASDCEAYQWGAIRGPPHTTTLSRCEKHFMGWES
jgi:hypothetical protein